MELPDDDYIRKLRCDLGAVHRMVAGVAFGRADRVAMQMCDATPWDQREFAAAPALLDEVITIEDGTKQRRRRRWVGTGAYEIADQSGKGEALAVKEKCYGRLRSAVEALRVVYTKRHGAAATDAALPAASDVRIAKLARGVFETDNASAATACAREVATLVEADVKDQLGEEEWAKLSEPEREGLVKMWCVMRSLSAATPSEHPT